MLKMPVLSVFGEAASFAVKLAGRAASGIAATAIGAGLLSLGIFNLPIQQKGSLLSFADILGQCHADHCTTLATFIVLALGMVLGFSERALGTFEDAVFAAGSKKPAA